MATIAVILAGGLGVRMGGEKPKQFFEIGGKPILIHSLETFNNQKDIDKIILVINNEFKELFVELLKKYHFHKLETVTLGGKERSDSSRNALKHIKKSTNTKVLIHDAVRPFVSTEVISRVVEALNTFEAVNVGIPATDTILYANTNQEIATVPPRENIYLAQTPQGFLAHVIHRAYELAENDKNFTATDDCGVVHRYCPEVPIKIVEGDVENIKITYPSDLARTKM